MGSIENVPRVPRKLPARGSFGGYFVGRFSFYRGIRGVVFRAFDASLNPEIMNVAFLDLAQ